MNHLKDEFANGERCGRMQNNVLQEGGVGNAVLISLAETEQVFNDLMRKVPNVINLLWMRSLKSEKDI